MATKEIKRFSAAPVMITSGLVVDGVSHGLQAHLPYNHQAVAAAVHSHRMSYVEPSAYLKSVVPPPPSPQQQQQSSDPPTTSEFLRPLPKPAPVNPLKTSRVSSKYAADCRPVNLTATKEPLPPPPPPVDHHLRLDDRHHPYPVYGHPRLYVSASPYHPYPMHQPPAPYGVYTSPYASLIPRDTRHHLMQPPQDQRYPSPPNKNLNGSGVGNQVSPSSSPPEQFKVPNGRDNKLPLQQQQQQQQRILPPPPSISTVAVPAINNNNNNINNNNNNNNNNIMASVEPLSKKMRRIAPESPPSSQAAKTSNFTKGSLIRLANGNIKKVEDMRTEDFLNSVENSDLHKIDPSTVVRIEPVTDSTAKGNIKITLSYGDQRNQIGAADSKNTAQASPTAACKSHQVEMESGAEHPYFVFGRGWASWSPAKTLARYGLTCQRLQVGDVCVSLTMKRSAAPAAAVDPTTHGKRRQPSSVTVHQKQLNNVNNLHKQQQPQQHNHHHSAVVQSAQRHQQQQQQQQQLTVDDDKNGRNKRRWSAPDPEPNI